jgi:hypothetical protein
VLQRASAAIISRLEKPSRSRKRSSHSHKKLPWFRQVFSKKESWEFTIPSGNTGSTLTTTQLFGPSTRTSRSTPTLCSITILLCSSLLPGLTAALIGPPGQIQEA